MRTDRHKFDAAVQALKDGHKVHVVDNRGNVQTVLHSQDDVSLVLDTMFVKMADREWRCASACHLEVRVQ